MAGEQARELRNRGIKAARAGEKDEARKLLKQSIKLEPDSEPAWLWLASVARDKRERIFCLQKLLEINPDNETASKALQAMGIEPPPRPAPAQPAPPPPTPIRSRIDDSLVPVPDPDQLDELKVLAEDVTLTYLSSYQQSQIEWVHKPKRRAGERDVWTLRFQVTGIIIGVLAILGIAGAIFVANSPEAQAILFAPTSTATKTPTVTPTFTPGFTPTPSATMEPDEPTYTPTPTLPPVIPTSDRRFSPTPTQPYLPERAAPAIIDALKLMEQGKYDEALPILADEREQTTQLFNPNPYYYGAIALARSGDPQAGLDLLADAETRVETIVGDSTRATYRTLIDVGYADVYLQLAQDALASNNAQQARNFLRSVENKTRSVLQDDPNFAEAYLLLSRRYRLDKQYNNALQALNDGLEVPGLLADQNLRVEKGDLYFEQGEYDLAVQQANEVLEINVYSEPAYLLQIRSTLAQGKAGLAVLRSQSYLFYYPDSIQGFKLLGDARVAEGNTDLALETYTKALQGSEDDPAYLDVLVARANLYSQQRRYDLAREDLTRALAIKDQPEIQALRMQAAYGAGNYAIALNDADELVGSGVIPDAEIWLLQARILVDQSDKRDVADLQQAIQLLSSALSGLPANEQAVANEYRARASYLLEDYTTALTAISAAMAAGETGSRHYWRGLILEARGEEADITQAIHDYEWVVTWSYVYPYSFLQDSRKRLEKLTAPPPEDATPTPESL